MAIKISKWQPPSTSQSPRYYLNGVKYLPSGIKVWIERVGGLSGRLAINSQDKAHHKLSDLLDALLEEGLITSAEHSSPSIDLFERLASAKATKTEPSTSKKAAVLPLELNNEVTIIIDHREPDSIFKAFNAIKGVKVETQVLAIGDFVFAGGMIERKSADDLTQSIIDKRLFFQSDEMAASDNQLLRAVIIEGDPYATGRIGINAIDGAISYLAVLQGLTVLNSQSPQHTANLVARMASHAIHGLGYEISYRQAKPKTIDDQILFVAQGLPGIGVESSKALLKHFGSLAAVFRATDKEIMAIDGFGKKTAEKIVGLLNEVWGG